MSSDKMEIDNTSSPTIESIDSLINQLSAMKISSGKTKKRRASDEVEKTEEVKKRRIPSAHTPPSPPITKEPQEQVKSRKSKKNKTRKVKGKSSRKNAKKNKKEEEDMKMDISPYGSETGKKDLIGIDFQKKVLKKFISKRGTMGFIKKEARKVYYEGYISNINRIKNDRQYEINERRGLNTSTIVTAVLIGHGGDLIKEYFEDDSTLILSTAGVCGLPGIISNEIGVWYLNEFEKNIKKHIVINEFLIKAQKILKPLYKIKVNEYLQSNDEPDMNKYLPGLKFADDKELNCQFIVPLCDRFYIFENINLSVNKKKEYSEFRIVDILKRHVKKNGSIFVERYIDYPTNLNELYLNHIGSTIKTRINNNKHTSFKEDGTIKTITLGNIVEIFKDTYGINTNLNIVDMTCRVIDDDFSRKEGIIPNISDEELVVRVNKEFEKGEVLASRKLG
jgi:hypothetical protein